MQELLDTALAAPEGAAAGATALAVWLRLAAMRKLRWNVNYNVKPREISAAQVRCWLAFIPYTLKRLRMMPKHEVRLTADAAAAVCTPQLAVPHADDLP